MKNPADDNSMEELKEMRLKAFYLENGIQWRKTIIQDLLVEIEKENVRLEEQGYKPREAKVTPILGMKL